MARRLRRDNYTVGWICALHVELAAAQEMLDEMDIRVRAITLYTLHMLTDLACGSESGSYESHWESCRCERDRLRFIKWLDWG